MSRGFSIKTIFTAIDRISPSVRKMSSGVRSFSASAEKDLKKFDKALSKLSAPMFKTAAAGMAVAGVGIGAGFKSAIESGMEFEKTISGVGAVGLKARSQIADLEKKALELGATTKFTATEAAQAMELMARSGYSNAQILGGIDGILAAAAAEGVEVAEVAGVVSNAINAFGLDASQASYVSDLLATASSKTNSTLTSLGESLKNLAPVAKGFGISLKDSVAMTALLQDVGLDASEAGTATATMLTKLAKPSDQVIKQMNKMGVAFKDAQGNMLPPVEIFNQMRAASKKLGGNMDQVAFFADLVGLRGQKAALGLQRLFDSEKGSDLREQLEDVTGNAQKMADLRMDNLDGDLNLLRSAVDAVRISIYSLQSEGLRRVTQSVTKWVEANKELITQKVEKVINEIAKAAKWTYDNFDKIVYWAGKLATLAGIFLAISTAIKVVTGAVAALNFVLGISPLGWLVIGIVGAAALIIAFWPEIKDMFAALSDWLFDKAEWLINAFRSLWGALPGFFSGLWDLIKKPYVAMWEFVVAGAKLYYDIFTNAWEGLVGVFSAMWDGVKTAFDLAFGPIISAIKWVISKLGEITGFQMPSWVPSWLGGGDAGAKPEGSTPSLTPSPEPPQAPLSAAGHQLAIQRSEETKTSRSEVTIRDETRRAQITKPSIGGAPLNIVPSGAF